MLINENMEAKVFEIKKNAMESMTKNQQLLYLHWVLLFTPFIPLAEALQWQT